MFKKVMAPEGDVGGGGSGGAPAGANPNPGAGAPATGGAAPDWTSSLNEDLRGFVQNKGFKDPGMVLESYRNLEKLRGVPEERLMKLPEKLDSPEMMDIYNRLGRPKDAKEYTFEGDEKTAAWAKKTFHDIGLPKSQADKLAAEWNKFNAEGTRAQQEAYQAQVQQQEQQLKTEWGQAYDQNVNVAKRAALAFGLDGATVDKLESAMGYAGVMKFLSTVGSKIGEDKFVDSNSRSGFGSAMTPEAARNRIDMLKSDIDFAKRYANGDSSARAEMDRLHRFAYDT